jgi:hypothetical protein
MKTRRREPLPAKGCKLVSHFKGWGGFCGAPLQAAAQAARDVLLGPVVGDLGYDMEVTRRYRLAAEIVNGWPGLGHRERIALNSGLPWTEAVHLVWASTRRAVDREAG